MSKKISTYLTITLMVILFATCKKEKNQAENSLIGKWSGIPSYNNVVEITKNNINFIMGGNEIWSYRWISNDSIEIVRPDYTTKNEVVFHNNDRVTIKAFWKSDAAVSPAEYNDATLTRAGK